MKNPTNLNILPLHTHTTYSLMDGVSDIQQYIKYCLENGLEACSCTDHGYVLGLYDLINKSSESNIKGIPGIEIYLSPHEEYIFNPSLRKFDYFHLTLWAQNENGYNNLISISNASWGPGRVVRKFGQPKPRVRWEDLEQYREDIICGSGCIEGPIVKSYLREEKDMAAYNAYRLMEIFQDKLFAEVMPHKVDRDWEVKDVFQVDSESGFTYTFKGTDIIETEIGKITVKEAFEKKVSEIYCSVTKRPQDHPISDRIIKMSIDSIDDSDEDNQPENTSTRKIIIT
jgi:DNA polymerase III alpha subunit